MFVSSLTLRFESISEFSDGDNTVKASSPAFSCTAPSVCTPLCGVLLMEMLSRGKIQLRSSALMIKTDTYFIWKPNIGFQGRSRRNAV